MRRKGSSVLYFKEVNRMLQNDNMTVCPEHNTGTVIVKLIPRRISSTPKNTPCQWSFNETVRKMKHSTPVVTGFYKSFI